MSATQFGLSPKQIASIVECEDYRINIWAGAVRSGKTIASIVAFFMAVNRAPKSGLILIVGRTLQTIERNILEPMQDETVFGKMATLVTHTRGSSVAIICGRTVHLIGASDVRAEGKLRGVTASLAMADEIVLLPENFFQQLLSRLSKDGARLLGTTNPAGPNHWLKKNFIDKEGTVDEEGNIFDLKHWHFTMPDNPSLSAKYIASQKAEKTGLYYSRDIDGMWVSADGAVYDMWDPKRHVIQWEDLPDMQRILGVGIDHGITNPTVAIMLGLGVDNNLYLMDEWRRESSDREARWSNVQLSNGIREWMAGEHHPRMSAGYGHAPVIIDPSATDLIVQMKQDGIRAHLANNEVLYGIRTIGSLLAMDRLKVSTRCPGLIREMPDYSWSAKATEKGDDAVNKTNDHSEDAGRYSIITTERRWRRFIKLTEPASTAA